MAENRLFEITSRLDRIFDSSNKVDDDEIKSHLARYLCVLTSGYIEEAMKIIIREHVTPRASQNISNYVNSSARMITNLRCERIGKFLSEFNSEWKENFENQISDEEKDAIDSVVANRHLIAHGRNVGVSYVHVKNWYENTKSVVKKIHNIVNS